MSSLKLYLLGPPRIEVDGGPIDIKRRKALALLVYLAVSGEPQRRDTLATLFWPDTSQSQARAALTRHLYELRKILGQDSIATDRETARLSDDNHLWLDTNQFQRRLADCPEATANVASDCLDPLTKAVTLYRDDFLTGFTLSDCPDFDEWQFFQSEGLRQQLAVVLKGLIQIHTRQGDYEAAIPQARRWLGLDPLHEAAHQQLMQLYASNGQQSAALRQYQLCVQTLQNELGIAPTAETTALHEQIRVGKFSRAGPVFSPLEAEAVSSLPARFPASLSELSFILADDEESAATAGRPVVAREPELAYLANFLALSLSGQGRVVFVTAGAGHGKTTLVQELAQKAQEKDPALVAVSANCNAQTGLGDPYLPFREALSLLTGEVEAKWAGGGLSQRHAVRLWELMPVSIPTLVDQGPDLIDTLVSGPALLNRITRLAEPETECQTRLAEILETRQAQAGVGSKVEQSQIFAQVTAVLQSLAVEHPLLLVLEDLQWADAASISLLFHLGRRIRQNRLLIVGTYRPDEVALGWGSEPHPLAEVISEFKQLYGQIELDLAQAASARGREFVDAFLDTEPNQLGADFRQALYQQTGGHALFTVELLREMQERGDLVPDDAGRWVQGQAIDWRSLPGRVEGMVEKRIGHLNDELRQLLTIASVEGEDFTAEVVARAYGMAERELVQRLSGELTRRHRLVTIQGVERLEPEGQRLSRYRFRHNLFQKYLYQSLDEAERTYLHEDVGNALEALYGEQTETIAVPLARHFREAGLTAKAIDYLQKAGQYAADIYANHEAEDHLNAALTMLKTLPETSERSRKELDLLLALRPILLTTRGFAAPRVEQTVARIRELIQRVGEARLPFPALYGVYFSNVMRAEYQNAYELAEQLLGRAQREEDPVRLTLTHMMIGAISYYLGELASARAQLKKTLTLYDRQQHQALVLLSGSDSGVTTLCHYALALWNLGYADQALERINEALALAQELSHPFSLGWALSVAGSIHQVRGEVQAVQAYAEACITYATEQGFPHWLAQGIMQRGWVLAQQGQEKEGLVQIKEGFAAWRATGIELALSAWSIWLVEVHEKAGQAKEGFNLLAKALAAVEKSGEGPWEAELYRLKGELLLRQEETEAEVETCFLKAIDIARRQEGKSYELRATVSLARLWQSQGKRKEARQMLAEIYGWFTEGFDTADLKEVKALLEELS